MIARAVALTVVALAALATGSPTAIARAAQEPPPGGEGPGGLSGPSGDGAGPGSDLAPQGPAVGPELAPFDCLAPLGPGGLGERFAEIAARYPERARLEPLPLGSDAAAPALVQGAPAGTRPALALHGWDDAPTWRAALAVAQELLVEPANRAGLLERVTIYLLPELEPERAALAGVVAPRNFPVGWRPETLVPGAGPYPLAAPAARTLAAFLEAHPSLSLLLALDDGPCTGSELEELGPERYRRELQPPSVLEAAPLAVAPASLCAGTAASFAWGARGVFPARLSTPPLLDPLERQRATVLARAVLDAAERSLPRILLAAPEVGVLRPGEVRLDVSVENAGGLPTLSAIGVERRLAGPVELAVSGARVLACAAGPSGGVLAVCRARAGRYPLGQIPGRGAMKVCLVLAGAPGTEVVLTCTSPRAGTASLTLALP